MSYHPASPHRHTVLTSFAVLLGACRGGTDGPNPPPPPPPPAPVLTTVEVTPGTATPAVGDSVQLTATPKDANGNPMAGKTVTWSSNATAIATVSASGLAKAVAAGTATITAMVEVAVDFQPSGLKFAVPASLKISVSTAPPNGLKLVGFSYTGQAESVVPAASADSGSSVTLPVSHFSGTGAAFGTPIQVETFLTTSQSNNQSSQFYINQLIALAGQSPRDFNAEMQVMRNWSANVIIPAITGAQNDLGLVVAESEYAFWLQFPLIYGLTGASLALAPEQAAVGAAAAPKLRAAIAGNNAECVAGRDLSAASNVLFWQTQAGVFGVDTPAEQLDRRTVLDGLCIQVVLTVVNYPITLSQPIDIRGDLTIRNNPVLSAVNGLSGRVGGKLLVQNNPALSTTAVFAWPLIVIGTETIIGNGFP